MDLHYQETKGRFYMKLLLNKATIENYNVQANKPKPDGNISLVPSKQAFDSLKYQQVQQSNVRNSGLKQSNSKPRVDQHL